MRNAEGRLDDRRRRDRRIVGVGFGFWWADLAAALLISLDIVHDGFRAASVAVAELIDGMPRELGGNAVAEDAQELRDSLARSFPDADIRLRETGRYIVAEVRGGRPRRANPAERLLARRSRARMAFRAASFVPSPERG